MIAPAMGGMTSMTFPGIRWLMLACIAVAMAGFGLLVTITDSEAAVYCKRVGYPRGCIVRPAPVAAPVVYCKTVGYPKGCVARAAPAPHVVYCKRVGYPKGCVVR